jgi:phosphate transport system substrate-binding protein
LAAFLQKADAKKAGWLRKLVDYCVTTGQSISDSMGYIPLPANIIEKIKTASAQIQ